jgi:ubiquinone/menaquinone biosynthesis C-methylase UbiE
MAIRNILPNRIKAPLWGERDRWGLTPVEDDPCWQEWQRTYTDFYQANQREGIGTRVNDAGYSVMSRVALNGKRVLEIGAGDIRHIKHWQCDPSEYVLADISTDMMDLAKKRLSQRGVKTTTLLVDRNEPLALDDASVDIIVSFYSLEHLYPLQPYLEEFNRVLKPGGCIVGAIPTEGGIAWGLGRMLTSRRWFKNNTNINPDKIICWEHPNFADDIISQLDDQFDRDFCQYWPNYFMPLLDVNLVISYKYYKSL